MYVAKKLKEEGRNNSDLLQPQFIHETLTAEINEDRTQIDFDQEAL